MVATKSMRTIGAWTDEAGLKFSGHESFVIRYGWLPKLYDAVAETPDVFASDERAILALGLGRNMVKSIRFWGDTLGLTGLNRPGFAGGSLS